MQDDNHIDLRPSNKYGEKHGYFDIKWKHTYGFYKGHFIKDVEMGYTEVQWSKINNNEKRYYAR